MIREIEKKEKKREREASEGPALQLGGRKEEEEEEEGPPQQRPRIHKEKKKTTFRSAFKARQGVSAREGNAAQGVSWASGRAAEESGRERLECYACQGGY